MSNIFGALLGKPKIKEPISPRNQPLSIEVYSGPKCGKNFKFSYNLDECEQMIAIRHCPVCQTNQCEECLTKLHSTKRRKFHIDLYQKCISHKVEKIQFRSKDEEGNFIPKEKTEEKCPTTGELLEAYCVTCDLLICSKCSKEKHSSHKIETKDKAISIFKEKIKKNQKEIDRQSSDIKVAFEELTQFSKNLDQNYVETKETITEYFDTIKKMAEKKKEEILKEIDTNYSKDSSIIKDHLEKHNYLTKVSGHCLKEQSSLIDLYDAHRYSKDILKVS